MARKSEDAPVTRRFFETTIAGLEARVGEGFQRMTGEMDRRFAAQGVDNRRVLIVHDAMRAATPATGPSNR